MTGLRTSVVAVALCAGALVTAAAPAGAAGQDPFVPPAPPDPISDTGWQPVEPFPATPPTRACGTRIVLDVVDRFFHLEQRVREYPGETTRLDFRGQVILRVTADDGRHARLDYSGPATIIIQEAEGVVDGYFRGANVFLPVNAVQAAAYRRAGMPRFSAFSGRAHIRDVFDPETGEPIRSRVISRPRFITNACHLLVQ